jgi:protocatechuate 3,4-dioxygenase beta subunit
MPACLKEEGHMRHSSRRPVQRVPVAGLAVVALLAGSLVRAQSIQEAPPAAPSTGRIAPQGEPGQPLHVSGVVVGPDGAPIGGASLYIYQTDHEGYYGVKPVSNNRDPRLKLFLRSDTRGRWAFDTIKPGSYPNGGVPAHIHFQVTAPGRSPKVFEIVFEDDPLVTPDMRQNPAFSVRPVAAGRVTERIVLN